MDKHSILEFLPYDEPFRFVDELVEISEEGVIGKYRYREDADFYRGHFKGFPVTPGVLLTETMAQIGLVCLGIYLLKDELEIMPKLAFSEFEAEFLKPVYPGEEVLVRAEKEYFRFRKLKVKAEMHNAKGELVARARLAGMILKDETS
jgi:3-hydroxyacyl-[acyl-carrier-protein] dehydratase